MWRELGENCGEHCARTGRATHYQFSPHICEGNNKSGPLETPPGSAIYIGITSSTIWTTLNDDSDRYLHWSLGHIVREHMSTLGRSRPARPVANLYVTHPHLANTALTQSMAPPCVSFPFPLAIGPFPLGPLAFSLGPYSPWTLSLGPLHPYSAFQKSTS